MDIIKDEKEFKKKNQANIKAKKALAEKFFLKIARIAGISAKELELKGRGYSYDIMLAGTPLWVCDVEFTDGEFKWYDGKGYCTKWTVNSDSGCNIHCGFFTAYDAMLGEDGKVTFKDEGDLKKFKEAVTEKLAELDSRVLYQKDGIVAYADKQSRYGIIYLGKKEYRVEFYHDTKGALCFQIRNTKILATHFGIVSKLILNKIIPAMEE
jgi:hypothetical protein